MAKNLIKQDINCLENPLWFQDEKLSQTKEDGYVWKTDAGYVFRAGYRPPVKTDGIFLLYLLLQCQKDNWSDEITLSRYQILKACGLDDVNTWYARLEESLKRWAMVGIEFQGRFYDGKDYSAMFFGIIDDWAIEKETKLLKVRFSKRYLEIMRHTTFYKYLNFDQVKTLRSPLATRLYEILIKSFQGRNDWPVNACLLAQKIPMAEKYPAHIIPKIKSAVNRINQNTDLQISLEVNRKERGKVILIFTKEAKVVTQPKAQPRPAPTVQPSQPDLPVAASSPGEKSAWVKPASPEFDKLVEILPWERRSQKTLLEMLWKAFQKHGFDHVAWNIRYANRRAVGNYPAYLLKALKANYGQALREEEEVRQITEAKQQEALKGRATVTAEQDTRAREDTEQAQAFLASLPELARKALEEETISRIAPGLRVRIEQKGRNNSISFQSMLRLVALEHLRTTSAGESEKTAVMR